MKDNFTKSILKELIIKYNSLYEFYSTLNHKLYDNKKKLRKPNYPSEISENIVKFAIIKKYNVFPIWNTKIGDLVLDNKQLEVKASLDLFNGGPSSFGPIEKWYKIYFVDCIKHHKLIFTVYEINLSNDSELWKNIKVNKKQTYENQCCQGRRPRITFSEIIKQIPDEYIKIIFSDNIDNL